MKSDIDAATWLVRYLAVCLLATSAAFFGCNNERTDRQSAPAKVAPAGGPPAKVSPAGDLEDSARSFRLGAVSNRCDEASRLVDALPKCPETSRKSIASGTLVTYDYSKPTYRLTSARLLQLLGAPESQTIDSYTYVIATDSEARSMGFLVIQIHDDYVVDSFVYGSPTVTKWTKKE